jgi:hypothetical protein
MAPFDMLLYAGVVFGWSTSWLPLKWQLGVDGSADDGAFGNYVWSVIAV